MALRGLDVGVVSRYVEAFFFAHWRVRIEAAVIVRQTMNRRIESFRLTFEKLFAGVLLEERFVSNRTSEVVNHELEDGFNLGFGITGVVGNGSILYLSE